MFWVICFLGVFFTVAVLVMFCAFNMPHSDSYRIAACDCCCHWQPLPDDDMALWGVCYVSEDSLELRACGEHCTKFDRGPFIQKVAQNGEKTQA